MITEVLQASIQLWLAGLLLTVLSVSLIKALFKNSEPPALIFFCKFVSLVFIAYWVFLVSTLKLLPLGYWSILSGVFILTLGSSVVLLKDKALGPWLLKNSKVFIIYELVFLGILLTLVYLKSLSPEIMTIERPMDFGFIKALTNSEYLPLEDIWMSGKDTNYYYFGHVMAFVLLLLSGLNLEVGFLAMQGWLYGVCILSFFVLCRQLIKLTFKPKSNHTVNIAATITGLIVMVGGSLYSLFVLLANIIKEGSLGWGSFFFSQPTRIIEGTITEYPFYSFIIADLHAHTWGIAFMITSATLIALIAKEGVLNKWSFNNFLPYFGLMSFILATAFMNNSWDVISIGSLFSLFLLSKLWSKIKVKSLLLILAMGAIAFTLAQVWYLPYQSPDLSVGFVGTKVSNPWSWFKFWGLPTLIIALGCWLFYKRKMLVNSLLLAILSTVIILLVSMELLYIKDILRDGEYWRANTVFKFTSQAWVLSGMLISVSIYTIISKLNKNNLGYLVVGSLLFVSLLYPSIAVKQAFLDYQKSDNVGLSKGSLVVRSSYPQDYVLLKQLDAYIQALPKQDRLNLSMVEAAGDSYGVSSRMSVGLGIPTVIGQPVHEWTWRGSYDEVGQRTSDVAKLYQAQSVLEMQEIIDKYSVNLIILGQLEQETYPNSIVSDLLLNNKPIAEYKEVKAYLLEP